MCRIGTTFGIDKETAIRVYDLQESGTDQPYEIFRTGKIQLIHGRFSVTSSEYDNGTYPLRGDRYALNYNGEVYGWKDKVFIDQEKQESDAHFGLNIIEKYGVESFLEAVDFQGSYQIYDTIRDETYIAVDQLNTSGYFYAWFDGQFIGASESQVVNTILDDLGAPSDTPINIIKNGTYLKINSKGESEIVEYRPTANHSWEGADADSSIEEATKDLSGIISESVRRRIPASGPVSVLCSGGVDSSLILAYTVQHLREQGEMDRLQIFTLGSTEFGDNDEENDLQNTLLLLNELGIPEDHLQIIDPQEIESGKKKLYENFVFSDNPRLITPNPILNTQVRHSVMMSCVLGEVVKRSPETKVVLTGDCADEIFAGYNSMWKEAKTPEELRRNIRQKLDDLPLNDAGRLTLASLFGCKHYLRKSDDLETSPAPVEVRHPFTSHKVLEFIQNCPIDFVLGGEGEKTISKHLLRLVALHAGVPESIAMRKKIPFNEGGTGTKNADKYLLEKQLARRHKSYEEVKVFVKKYRSALVRLGILEEETQESEIEDNFAQIVTVQSAWDKGLQRMLNGNVFREHMPDCVYSTSNNA